MPNWNGWQIGASGFAGTLVVPFRSHTQSRRPLLKGWNMDTFEAQAAHEQGWRAREQGHPRESNPHARDGIVESDLFRWWDKGWKDSDEEIQWEKEMLLQEDYDD